MPEKLNLTSEVRLTLPEWVDALVDLSRVYADDEARTRLAVELSTATLRPGGGGPFAAVIFGPDDRVVAAGVNCVLPLSCSAAHAEMMACMLAQQRLQRARLNRDAGNRPIGPYTLATSSQPCCQCYGAIVWAGIDRLVMAARAEDVQALTTFDEGPLPADWIGELERRGIEVVRDVCREDACNVLRAYTESGGATY